MRLFKRDERLNLGPGYLTPGYAYGGSCLPKDVEALGHLARRHHVELPVLQSVPRSNELHVQRACRLIEASGCDRVGFLGLSFKPGTDDLRSSPLLDLVQFCLGKGLHVRIFDEAVQVARLVGSNRAYALGRIRNLEELLVADVNGLASQSLIVVGHGGSVSTRFVSELGPHTQVIELVRLDLPAAPERQGLCW
jgi:GDP-mannose 6-dehydrogenase